MKKINAQNLLVTQKQGIELAQKAKDYGVSRESFNSFLKDKKRTDKFFSKLYSTDWFGKLQVEAERIDAIVYLIPSLVVDYTIVHADAAEMSGIRIQNGSQIKLVGDQYQLPTNKVTEETVILLNWQNAHGNYEKAIEWGLSNNLKRTTPHIPFFIGINLPNLNSDLGKDQVAIIETTGCMLNGVNSACYVWYYKNISIESEVFFKSEFGREHDWFAFIK